MLPKKIARLFIVSTYLDEIAAFHRERAKLDSRDLDTLERDALSKENPGSFRDALMRSEFVALIAEVKRRSPSKGNLNSELNLDEVVERYVLGGARAISVLTDSKYFSGSLEDLRAVKSQCHLPILRKDFTVSPLDIYDAKLAGASAVLLIVAILSVSELGRLYRLAQDVGLEAVVEVHSSQEVEVALSVGAEIVGVNQRNLHTFEIDYELATKLIADLPSEVCKVAESGISDRYQIERVASAGCDAVLVGESLVIPSSDHLKVESFATVPRRVP